MPTPLDWAGRTCPRCSVPMRVLLMEDVQVDLCPRCMGIWFDAGELSRAAGLRFDDSATGSALAAARRSDRRCPSCGIPLRERELDAGSEILVDQCQQCSGLFLDHGEFARVKEHFTITGASLRQRRESLYEKAMQEAVPLDEHTTAPLLERFAQALSPETDLLRRTFTPAVVGIIAVCAVALVVARLTGMRDPLGDWGLATGRRFTLHQLPTFLTYMLLHGGWLQLIGNAYFLWVAGSNVEDRLGWRRFLGLFFLSGLLAGIVHALTLASPHTAGGVDGAVSGVVGAYCAMFSYAHLIYRRSWAPLMFLYRGWQPLRADMGEGLLPMYLWFGLWFGLVVGYWWFEWPAVSLWGHLAAFTFGLVVGHAYYSREEAKRRREMVEGFRARHRAR